MNNNISINNKSIYYRNIIDNVFLCNQSLDESLNILNDVNQEDKIFFNSLIIKKMYEQLSTSLLSLKLKHILLLHNLLFSDKLFKDKQEEQILLKNKFLNFLNFINKHLLSDYINYVNNPDNNISKFDFKYLFLNPNLRLKNNIDLIFDKQKCTINIDLLNFYKFYSNNLISFNLNEVKDDDKQLVKLYHQFFSNNLNKANNLSSYHYLSENYYLEEIKDCLKQDNNFFENILLFNSFYMKNDDYEREEELIDIIKDISDDLKLIIFNLFNSEQLILDTIEHCNNNSIDYYHINNINSNKSRLEIKHFDKIKDNSKLFFITNLACLKKDNESKEFFLNHYKEHIDSNFTLNLYLKLNECKYLNIINQDEYKTILNNLINKNELNIKDIVQLNNYISKSNYISISFNEKEEKDEFIFSILDELVNMNLISKMSLYSLDFFNNDEKIHYKEKLLLKLTLNNDVKSNISIKKFKI